jgi:hypothetical protein
MSFTAHGFSTGWETIRDKKEHQPRLAFVSEGVSVEGGVVEEHKHYPQLTCVSEGGGRWWKGPWTDKNTTPNSRLKARGLVLVKEPRSDNLGGK